MKLLLSEKMDVAEGTMAFRFEPEKPVRFTPGQFGDFTDQRGVLHISVIALAEELAHDGATCRLIGLCTDEKAEGGIEGDG